MYLASLDPRILKPNPNNPRRTAAPAMSDEQLAANIRDIGLLQPPLARDTPDGMTIIVGHRRVAASIVVELPLIPVLVVDDDTTDDSIRALSENVQRANMNPVDQWRAIEAAITDRWTEEAIATAMGLSVRTIRKLRLLAHIHPAMLDRMALGDMPDERVLRIIAAATADEQANVWKKHKPKKQQPKVSWFDVSRALEKRRISASVAKFGPDEEQAFGIVWEEDLFEQGGKDARYTTQVEAFFGAQQAWLEANLPKNGVLLPTDEYGRPKLPPKAERSWGQPRKGDTIGCNVDPRTGEITEVAFRVADTGKTAKAKGGDTAATPKPRPDITQKGLAKIGDLRTAALHKAVEGASIDDETLIALLVLALGARNVSVEGPHGRYTNGRAAIAAQLLDGNTLTHEPATIRAAARAILTQVLSCRQGMSNSGGVALVVGDAIGADAYLANMATEEFLSCLSKGGIERAASIVNVLPRQRGKDTRAALIAQVGDGTYILPAARFAPNGDDLAELARAQASEADAEDVLDGDDAETGADPDGLDDEPDVDSTVTASRRQVPDPDAAQPAA
jgi:ParB/RepB/Spo0J family partition protein